ncbi:MAG: YdbL family protein [Gammaproteobacteria bacterium]|nr:YdbL family protein [Gammaproteobacteria bacterium]
MVLPAARAQANVDVSTPAINAITNSMQARHQQLRPFYDSGAVGLTRDGLIAVRDPKAVSLKDRQTVNALVAEDNRDRNALYREVARANGHPEWEPEIRATFARRWVQKAHPGWWYESASGWQQK